MNELLLNGTTPRVGINADCYRLNSMRVISAGANARPTGAITLRPSGGGTTIGYIKPLYLRARNVCYTVPKDKTLYVTSANFSYSTTGNANKEYARIYTRATQNNGFRANKLFYPLTEITIQNASLQVIFTEPTKLLSGVDIKVSGIAYTAGVATCSLRGWLENND